MTTRRRHTMNGPYEYADSVPTSHEVFYPESEARPSFGSRAASVDGSSLLHGQHQLFKSQEPSKATTPSDHADYVHPSFGSVYEHSTTQAMHGASDTLRHVLHAELNRRPSAATSLNSSGASDHRTSGYASAEGSDAERSDAGLCDDGGTCDNGNPACPTQPYALHDHANMCPTLASFLKAKGYGGATTAHLATNGDDGPAHAAPATRPPPETSSGHLAIAIPASSRQTSPTLSFTSVDSPRSRPCSAPGARHDNITHPPTLRDDVAIDMRPAQCRRRRTSQAAGSETSEHTSAGGSRRTTDTTTTDTTFHSATSEVMDAMGSGATTGFGHETTRQGLWIDRIMGLSEDMMSDLSRLTNIGWGMGVRPGPAGLAMSAQSSDNARPETPDHMSISIRDARAESELAWGTVAGAATRGGAAGAASAAARDAAAGADTQAPVVVIVSPRDRAALAVAAAAAAADGAKPPAAPDPTDPSRAQRAQASTVAASGVTAAANTAKCTLSSCFSEFMYVVDTGADWLMELVWAAEDACDCMEDAPLPC